MLQTILKYAGAAYLICLAAAIAMSGPVTPGQDNARGPMTFWGAAMFQWINAKGWVMVIGTITAYAGIAAFPWNIVIQVLLSLLLGAAVLLGLGAVRQRAAPGPDLARGRACLQHRDGASSCWPRSIRSSWTHDAAPRHARNGFPLTGKML